MYLTWFSKSLYGPVYLCPGNVQPFFGIGNLPICLWMSIAPPFVTNACFIASFKDLVNSLYLFYCTGLFSQKWSSTIIPYFSFNIGFHVVGLLSSFPHFFYCPGIFPKNVDLYIRPPFVSLKNNSGLDPFLIISTFFSSFLVGRHKTP